MLTIIFNNMETAGWKVKLSKDNCRMEILTYKLGRFDLKFLRV